MPLLGIIIQPGVYKEDSGYAAKGRWVDSKNVRWWKGQPELIGGCTLFTGEKLDTASRGVHAWRALDGKLYIAWGTQNKLWLWYDGTLYDITPVGLPSGDGSAETLVGPWDAASLGYGETYFGGAAPLLIQPANARTWSLTNFGEDLVANYFGGGIYYWDKSVGASDPEANPAVLLGGQTPQTANGIFVSSQARHLVAIGAHDGTSTDSLNVRWCAREDIAVWTAGATTTAGSKRVDSGGRLVSAVETRGGHLLLTDFSAHLMRWVGSPFHFSIEQQGVNCGLISPRAVADYGGVTYWMGFNGFFYFDGSVKRLECDVQKYVFDNLNRAEIFKIYCGVNKKYNEVWWFYTTVGTENSRVVIFNVQDRTWYLGEFERTSWIDSNVVSERPLATDSAGNIYKHEDGADFAGAQIPYHMESSEIEYENGEYFSHVRKIVPDFERIVGDHNLYLKARPYPQRAERVKGPYMIDGDTGRKSVRARGRSIRIRQESGSEGETDFRWGAWRADGRLHGKRA